MLNLLFLHGVVRMFPFDFLDSVMVVQYTARKENARDYGQTSFKKTFGQIKYLH